MGSGFLIRCKKCSYEYRALLGFGMMFPKVYQETVYAIKEGKFGEDHRAFFAAHPDAAVNCEAYMAVCKECGEFDTVKSLSLFLPKHGDGKDINTGCLLSEDLKADYRLAKKYDHKCSYCGGVLEPVDLINELSKKAVRCPKCKDEMQLTDAVIVWD